MCFRLTIAHVCDADCGLMSVQLETFSCLIQIPHTHLHSTNIANMTHEVLDLDF